MASVRTVGQVVAGKNLVSITFPLGIKTYTLKASALKGAFYFFNLANNPTNQSSMPGTIERINC